MPATSHPKLMEAAALDLDRSFYAHLPYQFARQYGALFQALLRHEGPVVFNCSAGKNRTGVAAALLLTAVGVPRETVTADYFLSNQTFEPARTLATEGKADAAARGQTSGSPMVRVLITVDARLLDATFAGIDARSRVVQAYFRGKLGVGPAELKRLRCPYLAQADR